MQSLKRRHFFFFWFSLNTSFVNNFPGPTFCKSLAFCSSKATMSVLAVSLIIVNSFLSGLSEVRTVEILEIQADGMFLF